VRNLRKFARYSTLLLFLLFFLFSEYLALALYVCDCLVRKEYAAAKRKEQKEEK